MRFLSTVWGSVRPRQWLGMGIDLLLPPNCVYCECDLFEHGAATLLCHQCQGELTSHTDGHCVRCAALAPPNSAPGDRCQSCRDRTWSFDQVVALGQYRSTLRSAVLQMKSPRQEPLTAAVARLLGQFRGERLRAGNFDVIIPIPVYWTKRLFHGTSSPETIAAILAADLQIPHETGLIRCRRQTLPQRTLAKGDRVDNVRGAFGLVPGASLNGARVLLVDDILTTGATCHEIARTLRRAGAAAVSVAVLARADEWV